MRYIISFCLFLVLPLTRGKVDVVVGVIGIDDVEGIVVVAEDKGSLEKSFVVLEHG